MNQQKIGKFIAEKRKEKGLTQEALANKLGITKNAVSKWERGLGLMDLSLLKPLSEILDISVTELLNGEEIKKEKQEEVSSKVLVNVLEYSEEKFKKSKIKSIIVTIVVIFLLLVGIFFSYKLVLLNRYTVSKDKDVSDVIKGLKNSKTIKIYKKTIPDSDYLVEGDIKIRNDFKDYEKLTMKNMPNSYVKYEKYNEKTKEKEGISISNFMQFIDGFTSNDITFYNDSKTNIIDNFNKADRKYFLLKNDINNDVDYFKYVEENYYKENNIFMSKREMMENYAFNLYTSIVIPVVDSITYIDGDYTGFMIKKANTISTTIIRNNKQYNFLLYGNDASLSYMIDLLSTLEIK